MSMLDDLEKDINKSIKASVTVDVAVRLSIITAAKALSLEEIEHGFNVIKESLTVYHGDPVAEAVFKSLEEAIVKLHKELHEVDYV